MYPMGTYCQIGLLHDPLTWYNITQTGEQVAKWDFQNNAIRTSPPRSAFVWEIPPLCNSLTSMRDFVPCDRGRAKGLLLTGIDPMQKWLP